MKPIIAILAGKFDQAEITERRRAYQKKWRMAHRERLRAKQAERVRRNPEKYGEYKIKWRNEHKDLCRGYCKKWRENHPEAITRQHINRKLKPGYNKKRAESVRMRRGKNIQERLRHTLRSRMSRLLRGMQKTGSSVRDIGCTSEQLVHYIESQFQIGMTWDNYGFGMDKWNVDHIIPLQSVNLADREQFLRVVHYTNLRPMWQPDNIARNRRVA